MAIKAVDVCVQFPILETVFFTASTCSKLAEESD